MAQAPRTRAKPVGASTRRQTKREAPEVKATRARVLLDDPNVRGVFDTARAELISAIERATLDGSAKANDAVLEHVRQLHALNELQRIILRPLVAERLQEQKQQRKRGLK